MELVLISSVGRGRAIRVHQPGPRYCRFSGCDPGYWSWPRIFWVSCRWAIEPEGSPQPANAIGCVEGGSAIATEQGRQPSHQTVAPTVPTRPRQTSPLLPRRPPSYPPRPPEPSAPPPKRFKVRDKFGNCVVARFHGEYAGKTALILPDGQLGTPNLLIPTDEPFRPLTADQLRSQCRKDPSPSINLLRTEHYLIFYKSTPAFAQESGRLLDDLYEGLLEAFRRNGFPVHDSEFPLVAVIFATDKDFRAHKQVDLQVQAYYEFFTNRIFFYEKSDRDKIEPKLSTLLKPQTVTHEGAHQILSNIGLQPRPSSWPLWLVEGLAEYCDDSEHQERNRLERNGCDQFVAHGDLARAR